MIVTIYNNKGDKQRRISLKNKIIAITFDDDLERMETATALNKMSPKEGKRCLCVAHNIIDKNIILQVGNNETK